MSVAIALVIASVIDVSIVLALTLVATAALRRRSASARHAVLVAGLLAAAAVPALELLVPAWEVPVAWGARAQDASSEMTLSSGPVSQDRGAWTAVAASRSFPWLEAIGVAWAAGLLVALGGVITGLVRLARATRRCTVIRSGPWRDLADTLSAGAVTLLQSDSPSLLLTWGHVRPVILLPSGAGAWSRERRAVVLAHELAHIRRGDWALQLGAESLRAIHWFNPLMRIACRRLRHESECACDDAVLDGGVEPTQYASHLLDLARQAVAYHHAWASTPAVANPSTLERRISAMLNHTGRRTPLTSRARACAAAAAIVVAAPIAAVAITEPAAQLAATTAGADVVLVAPAPAATTVTPAPPPRPAREGARAPAPVVPAQQSPGSISGVLSDPSGGVLPGVEVTLTGMPDGTVYSRRSDGAGSFTFPDLPAGRYTLVTALPGFTTRQTELELGAGEHLQRRLSMLIGSLQETITVLCGSGGAALSPRARGVMASASRAVTRAWPLFPKAQDVPRVQDAPTGPQPPVRVGGNVRAPRKVRDVHPICPPTLSPPPGGTVAILEAAIDPDGNTRDIRVLRDPSSALFAESAVEAVRQWQFTPTLLNNVPVPVIMMVTVLFDRE